MEEASELGNYLPLSFKSPTEQEYIAFLWDAFESNYTHGKYQFAFLAYHMLTMSCVYFNIWQIKQTRHTVNVRGRKRPIEVLFNLEHPNELSVVTDDIGAERQTALSTADHVNVGVRCAIARLEIVNADLTPVIVEALEGVREPGIAEAALVLSNTRHAAWRQPQPPARPTDSGSVS